MSNIVRFVSFTATKRFLVCSKLQSGYISSTWGQNVNISVDKIVLIEELTLTDKQKTILEKTQESKKKLEELKVELNKLKDLVPLAETATDEEKAARELTIKNINTSIDAIMSVLYKNSGNSEEANKYYLMAKNLKEAKENPEVIEISYKDKPAMYKIKIVMVNNKYEFEIEFVSEDDKNSLLNKI